MKIVRPLQSIVFVELFKINSLQLKNNTLETTIVFIISINLSSILNYLPDNGDL